MSEIFCDDGCSPTPEEVLARLEIGLKTEEELHPDFVAPTDRGLILLALPSKGETDGPTTAT